MIEDELIKLIKLIKKYLDHQYGSGFLLWHKEFLIENHVPRIGKVIC